MDCEKNFTEHQYNRFEIMIVAATQRNRRQPPFPRKLQQFRPRWSRRPLETRWRRRRQLSTSSLQQSRFNADCLWKKLLWILMLGPWGLARRWAGQGYGGGPGGEGRGGKGEWRGEGEERRGRGGRGGGACGVGGGASDSGDNIVNPGLIHRDHCPARV